MDPRFREDDEFLAHLTVGSKPLAMEAVQTGLKITPCSRKQGGHRWHSNTIPTM
jgi:hypothetical protein